MTTQPLFSTEGLDARSIESLTQAIEKNNLPGFDYLEFKQSIAQLAQMSMDEATAHKSAFATASTLGLTKDKLIETAAYYRNVIVLEKEQFGKALENQSATKVAARQLEVKRLRDQIERNKLEIARLQDEIGGYLNQADQIDSTVKLEAEKLDKTRDAFEKAHLSVLNSIDRDIENLHKYL